MNFAYIDENETLFSSFDEKLVKLKYLSITPSDVSGPQVECNIHDLVTPYKEAVAQLIDLQKKIDVKKGEIDAFTELVGKLGKNAEYTTKVEEIIDCFLQDESLEALKGEYSNVARSVQSYNAAFALAKDVDLSNKYLCYVCIERPVDTFLDSCGHVICSTCSQKIASQCPFCRSTIKMKHKIFLS